MGISTALACPYSARRHTFRVGPAQKELDAVGLADLQGCEILEECPLQAA